jgi:hypothetical protein
MGLLDDAIRDHLDLKRKHGFAEDEVSRQEAEALGPARREVAPAELPPMEGEPAAEESLPPSAEPAETPFDYTEPADEAPTLPEEAPPVEEDFPPETPPVEEPPVEEPPVEAPEAPPGGRFEPAERDTGSTPPQGFPAVGSESDEAAEDEAGEDEAGEDVLEETPDFLQETPEHDRLWFEQKPPRDFDFD